MRTKKYMQLTWGLAIAGRYKIHVIAIGSVLCIKLSGLGTLEKKCFKGIFIKGSFIFLSKQEYSGIQFTKVALSHVTQKILCCEEYQSHNGNIFTPTLHQQFA